MALDLFFRTVERKMELTQVAQKMISQRYFYTQDNSIDKMRGRSSKSSDESMYTFHKHNLDRDILLKKLLVWLSSLPLFLAHWHVFALVLFVEWRRGGLWRRRNYWWRWFSTWTQATVPIFFQGTLHMGCGLSLLASRGKWQRYQLYSMLLPAPHRNLVTDQRKIKCETASNVT